MSLSQKAVLRLLICTLIGGALYGQQSIECTSPTYDPGPPSPTIRIGGRLKPSTGVLRVLVVFIRFNGDNETNSRWPNPSVMPDWAANIVDSDVSPTGNYTPGSLSHFFYENTYGSLHVVGSVYYVTTVHDEDYYHFLAGNVFYKRRVLTDEIFSTLDSAPYNVAFDEFDTWAANAEYDFTPDASDGSLDMCWLVTRNLHEANNPNGNNYPGYEFGTIIAQLWTSNTTFDGVTIGEGFGLSGSGISFFGIGPMYMPL